MNELKRVFGTLLLTVYAVRIAPQLRIHPYYRRNDVPINLLP
jgi:hypothetical protein